jgi:hypothetical protein
VNGRARRAILLIGIAGLACAAAGCDGFIGEWTILDGFQRRFVRLELGVTRESVIASLGKPQREAATLRLPQAKAYESEYERARASGATGFLYWDTGVDAVAVVGLDATGRVVFKCTAGT